MHGLIEQSPMSGWEYSGQESGSRCHQLYRSQDRYDGVTAALESALDKRDSNMQLPLKERMQMQIHLYFQIEGETH